MIKNGGYILIDLNKILGKTPLPLTDTSVSLSLSDEYDKLKKALMAGKEVRIFWLEPGGLTHSFLVVTSYCLRDGRGDTNITFLSFDLDSNSYIYTLYESAGSIDFYCKPVLLA